MKNIKNIVREYVSGLSDDIPDTVRTAVAALAIVFMAFGGTIAVRADSMATRAIDEATEARERQEVLWLARALYSETKLKEEQVLIAWVIRNRMESEKYPGTYREVVLQRNQFSGLNPSDKQYYTNIARTYGESGPGWDSALAVADAVYHASGVLRPIPETVTHFYSPHAVSRTPSWAADTKASHVVRDSEDKSIRFAFYDGVK